MFRETYEGHCEQRARLARRGGGNGPAVAMAMDKVNVCALNSNIICRRAEPTDRVNLSIYRVRQRLEALRNG
jgi:hypothetical protein